MKRHRAREGYTTACFLRHYWRQVNKRRALRKANQKRRQRLRRRSK